MRLKKYLQTKMKTKSTNQKFSRKDFVEVGRLKFGFYHKGDGDPVPATRFQMKTLHPRAGELSGSAEYLRYLSLLAANNCGRQSIEQMMDEVWAKVPKDLQRDIKRKIKSMKITADPHDLPN